MAPPFAYKTVIGTYKAPDGTPVAGDLRFIPSETVYDAAGNIVVPPSPIVAHLDGSGAFSIQLMVTDDPATTPTGWVWIVTELFGTQREWRIQVPSAAGSTVHIADLLPVTPVDVTYAYASLTTVLALDGRVTAAEATVTAAAASATSSAASATASALSAQIADNLQVLTLMGAI